MPESKEPLQERNEPLDEKGNRMVYWGVSADRLGFAEKQDGGKEDEF